MVDNISSLPVAGMMGLSAKTKDEPQQIKSAAEQFEALMISELLKAARPADSSGWLGTGDDEPGQTSLDLGEQQLAAVLAKNGGFGLAKAIAKDLALHSSSTAAHSVKQS